MFHDILSEDVSCFKANICFLKRSTNVISLDDFFLGKLSSKKINVVITFDDGYKSWTTKAIPTLKELSLPAIFFVSSGFIGLSEEKEAEFMRSSLCLTLGTRRITGSLSAEDMRSIIEKGFAIGGHTLNHRILGALQDSDQVRYEIAEDKKKLEKIIGTKIKYFAYPSGAYYNPEINLEEVLKESGYKGAVTTVSGFNDHKTSPYLLHREITGASMPGRVFKARVYGNSDAVLWLKQRITKVHS